MSHDRPHVLLVDREGPARRLAAACLERAGFRVTTADDGPSAWIAIRRTRPDAIVAEILIAGLDGLALCRQIRADPAARGVRVLIVSLLSAQSRAADCGADGFLRKPLGEQALVAAVEGLFDGLRVAS